MTIIIPMAGLSSRFARAGFVLPKYMLYAGGRSLFRIAVESFSHYFATCRFVFVARDVFDTHRFIDEECRLMGLPDYCTVMLSAPTRGQAETVALGLRQAEVGADEEILIFNIDTFRPHFELPTVAAQGDGYLEVFKGSGANWSYARTADGRNCSPVVETAEKREISDNCSTGIYHFRRAADFLRAFDEAQGNGGELYVAPLYNRLIAEGRNIFIHVIPRSAVIFCGVPEEYFSYLQTIIP